MTTTHQFTDEVQRGETLKQERLVQDVRIQGKINAAHREAFLVKFPNQVEHILRLLTERLQLGLDKRDGVQVTDPETWLLMPEEILAIAEAMNHINQIRLTLR